MPMFDFKCPKGHAFEDLVKSTVDKLPCPTCGLEAQKFLGGAPRVELDGTDEGFPSAYAAWPKKREKQIRWERSRSWTKRYEH